MLHDHVSKLVRCKDFDVVAPRIEVPAHLQVACCLEFHNQGTVGLVLEHLVRVELKGSSVVSDLRRKPPNDLSILFLILEDTKGAFRELPQIKR